MEEEEDFESSDSGGEFCKESIDNLFGSCEITSYVTSVSGFILNANVCTGCSFMQLLNVTKNVLNEIKTELVKISTGKYV